jgi:O-antigen ligase
MTGPAPLAPSWTDAFDAWRSRIDGLSAQHPQRIGWWMMIIGTLVLVVALPCSIALQNIAAAVLGAGWILARPPVLRLPGFWWGLAFTAWVGVSIVWWWQHGPIDGVVPKVRPEGMTYTWVGGLATIPVWRDAVWRSRILCLLALMLATAAALTLVQAAVGQGGPGPFRILPGAERKGSGWYNEHLTNGFICGLLALTFAIAGGAAPTWARWTGRIAGSLATLASMARSAWIGAAVGGALAVMTRGWRAALVALAGIILLVGVALGGLAVLKPEKFDKLVRGEDGRWPIWRTAMLVIGEHPLVGAGGQDGYRAADRRLFATANPGFAPEFVYKEGPLAGQNRGAPHAHNSFLSLAGERGLPAMVLYLGLLAAITWAAWRAGGTTRMLAFALVTAALAAGQFERLAGDVESGFALFTLLALALALAAPQPAQHTRQ